MKKLYELGDLTIDFRKFYQYYEEKGEPVQDIGWSDCWYCGEDCCGEIQDFRKRFPDMKTRLIPWYIRVFRLSNAGKYGYFTLGMTIMGIISYYY